VLSFLGVDREEFDFERPILSYGLDSLSATRLSSALQPFLHVSQVQLLAGVSWSELGASLQTRCPDSESAGNQHRAAQEILMHVLGVDERDFDPSIPLVSYGLDSLSASKLATALRPHLLVTQLMLMAGTTWTDLTSSGSVLVPNHDTSSPLEESIVELSSGEGIPLIVFPGISGRAEFLLPLRTHFSGALWGLQVTESTPITPFPALAAFLAEKIRQKQPHGPYRFAAYCALTVVAVAVAKLLEDSGQQILQMSFIDHFPMWWIQPETELLLREQKLHALVEMTIPQVIDLLRNDPLYGPDSREVSESEAAAAGLPHADKAAVEIFDISKRLATSLVQFLDDFYPQAIQRSYTAFVDPFTSWVSSVKAPFSLLIAEFGMMTIVPDASRELWEDLGARRCQKSVQQHLISGVGHSGILLEERTAAFLQQY
jgi:thioesterase domain-containing protein/aryl carrier-like protein